MEIDKELLKGYIEPILLSVLRDGDMYGYEIAKRVREISGDQFELKEGTMYLALKRLEKNEFIEAYWGDDEESGGGRRKYYRLLYNGNKRYEQKYAEWLAVKSIMERFLERNAPNRELLSAKSTNGHHPDEDGQIKQGGETK